MSCGSAVSADMITSEEIPCHDGKSAISGRRGHLSIEMYLRHGQEWTNMRRIAVAHGEIRQASVTAEMCDQYGKHMLVRCTADRSAMSTGVA